MVEPRSVDDVPVREIMSRALVAVRADCGMATVAEVFGQYGVGHVLVVDGERRYRGLAARDEVRLALSDGRATDEVGRRHAVSTPAVHPDWSVRETADAMLAQGADALPVAGPDGRIIGIVTWTDIVWLVAGPHAEAR